MEEWNYLSEALITPEVLITILIDSPGKSIIPPDRPEKNLFKSILTGL